MDDGQADIEDYVPTPNGNIEKALAKAAKDGKLRQGYRHEAPGIHAALFDAMKDLRCWVQPSGENKHLKAKYATLKDILEFVADLLMTSVSAFARALIAVMPWTITAISPGSLSYILI
jgi:hypothetical protein